jgi:hypothetical protein
LLVFSVLMLLGQQTAVAAYACAMTASSMGTVTAMPASAAMAAMGKTCPEMHELANHALCQKHCNPDNTAQPDARPGSVPPSLFAALPLSLPALATTPLLARRASKQSHLQQAPPPPAILLFCSLLI